MIEIRNLIVRYPGTTDNALDGVSLDIADGEYVAVMGANGSGKSTLARSLNGLIRPTAGEVTVDGWKTSDDQACRSIRKNLGMVFQNPHLQITSLTVEREIGFGLQNLGLTSEEIRRRVDEHLSASRLEEARHRPPRSLSAGEQQRLALAAVLAMRPRHLVLDEATSLLSPGSRKTLLRSVSRERASRRLTVFLITQFAEEAIETDRLILLRSGRVLLDGPPALVFAHYIQLGGKDVPVPPTMPVGPGG